MTPPLLRLGRAARLSLCAALLLGCAASRSPFRLQWQNAEREEEAGHYETAAHEWQRASELATKARDRDEATYRAGEAFARAGKSKPAEAAFTSLADAEVPGERGGRACQEAAQIARRRGDQRRTIARLEACVRRFPGTRIGPGVVRDLVSVVREAEGEASVATRLARLQHETEPGKLDEALRFQLAHSLLHLGREDEALAVLEQMVTKYRYPIGALWDDALWEISRIEAARGRTRAAISGLEKMLARREESHLGGSYERPTYAKARYKIAELIWNSERDPARASLEFERVWRDHRTHLLADDGLWQAARAAAAAGDTERACTLAVRLRDWSPKEPSRYVGCETLVCARAEPSPRACRSYVREAHLADPTRAALLE